MSGESVSLWRGLKRSRGKLQVCPLCGGTRGYQYNIKLTMQGEWGDEAETTGQSDSPVSVVCVECGARVSRKRAEGYDGPNK